MGRKYAFTVGEKTYIVDISESNEKWIAGVVPASGPLGYRPLWTCEAPSEEALKEKLDAHLQLLRAQLKKK